jgi:hypothetical protein
MKKQICVLALGVLLFAGLVTTSSGKVSKTTPIISTGDLLHAHNVPQRSESLSASTAEAVRLTSVYSDFSSGLPNFFERKLSVSISGKSFRRHMANPLGLREQIEVSDGGDAYQTVIEMGKLVEEASQMGDSQLKAVEFSIRTFGLIPFLNQLSDTSAECVYLGRTARREDKIEVKTNGGQFILYADQEHVIRKVEVDNRIIEYADYRPVEGVLLPFIERVFVKGKLMYELVFTRIELNPVFPAGYFSRAALSKAFAQ